MSNKPVLAIDFDDVLFPFSSAFIEYANKKLGIIKTVSDMTTYRLDTVYGIPYKTIIETIDSFMAQPWINNLQPLPNAKQVLTKLSSDYDLHIITARTTNYSDATCLWIDTHLLYLFTDIHFCGLNTSKLDICNKIKAIALIDDNAKNIENVLSGNLVGILFGEYAWHKELSNMCTPIKIKDWKTFDSVHNTILLKETK